MGGNGSNKKCVIETIHHLWEDFKRERLAAVKLDRSEIMGKVLKRGTVRDFADQVDRHQARGTCWVTRNRSSAHKDYDSRAGLLDAAFPL